MPRDSYRCSAVSILPQPPPQSPLRCSQWDDRQNSHNTLYTDCNEYGGMEGRNVIFLVIDHRFYEQTLINRCSFNIPNSYTVLNSVDVIIKI